MKGHTVIQKLRICKVPFWIDAPPLNFTARCAAETQPPVTELPNGYVVARVPMGVSGWPVTHSVWRAA